LVALAWLCFASLAFKFADWLASLVSRASSSEMERSANGFSERFLLLLPLAPLLVATGAPLIVEALLAGGIEATTLGAGGTAD